MADDAYRPLTVLAMPDLGQFSVARLERFAGLALKDGAYGHEHRELARRATYAAYCDCLALGLRREAGAALRRAGLHRPVGTVSVRREYLLALADTTDVGRRSLTARGIVAGSPDPWCPRASVLGVIADLEAAGMHSTVRAWGRELASRLRGRLREKGIESFARLMEMQGEFHADQHQGDWDDVVTTRTDRALDRGWATVTCLDPYPCELWRGWFEGSAALFGHAVRVRHGSGSCKALGGRYCRYTVAWR
jgi:hypothetical protein